MSVIIFLEPTHQTDKIKPYNKEKSDMNKNEINISKTSSSTDSYGSNQESTNICDYSLLWVIQHAVTLGGYRYNNDNNNNNSAHSWGGSE